MGGGESSSETRWGARWGMGDRRWGMEVGSIKPRDRKAELGAGTRPLVAPDSSPISQPPSHGGQMDVGSIKPRVRKPKPGAGTQRLPLLVPDSIPISQPPSPGGQMDVGSMKPRGRKPKPGAG